MQINIKSERAHRLARELTELTGESLTEAVTEAIAERLEREREQRRALEGNRRTAVQTLVAEFQRLPVVDPRPADEILYDAEGLPRSRA